MNKLIAMPFLSFVLKEDMDIPGSRNVRITFMIPQQLAMTKVACKRHTIADNKHNVRRRTMRHELPVDSAELNLCCALLRYQLS
jgi:hypothetical protein